MLSLVERLKPDDASKRKQLETHEEKPRKRRKRTARVVMEQVPGKEGETGGIERVVTQSESTYFKASSFHWLFLAEGPDAAMKVVPFGQVCASGECHALLDPAEDFDADPVQGSNETYEWAGTDADANSGLLLRRQHSCFCPPCRPLDAIRPGHQCANIATVGNWRQDTCLSTGGLGKRRVAQRTSIAEFARSVVIDHVYAAVGTHAERGGRPYWLLRTTSVAYQLKTYDRKLKLAKGTWVVKVRWYRAVSDNPHELVYELTDVESGACTLPVESMVQESQVTFPREFRASGHCCLEDESHLAITSHNLSNFTAWHCAVLAAPITSQSWSQSYM